MKRVAKDKYNQEIKNGDIIDIHQTVNGCRYFVVIDLDNLDVRYYDNNHQGVGFDTWVAIDRKYEYDVEELLGIKPDPNWGFIESEIEVIGRISDDELLQTQIGSRSGVDEKMRVYLNNPNIKEHLKEDLNNLSEKDIKLIIETNENPPPPNEKLKEAFKQYKTDMNMTNKEKLILDILTKDLESIIKVGEEQEEMLKDLRDNGYGDIHPFHRDEMKSGISYTHGYSVGHKCLAEQVIELLKMTEDEITSKIEDDKRIEEENKKYMEDLLKSFKGKDDE